MSDGHIFISYRVIESDFALKLAADLKNSGVNVWMDRFELKPGDDWARGIERGIDTCSAMLIALSPDYVESANCMRELYRAARKSLLMFPVLLRPVDLPYQLEGLQYVDFRDWRDEKVYRQKVDELLDALPAAQKGAVPDAETRYLTSLIAELESRKGVLEYVELSAQADAPEDAPARPDPYQLDEWAAGFSMLVNDPHPLTPSPLHREGEQKQKIALSGIAEAVEKYPRFVLIGEPGAGKTTTIRKLARDAARARLENPYTAPLPLFLYLPQWGDEPTPLDFVRKYWPFDTDPSGLLKQGDALLYLDGLNEMGGSGAEKARKLHEWFTSTDTPARVIVTCRAGDYAGDLKVGELPTVLAEELSEAQIRMFSASYLKEKSDGFLARVLPDDERHREDNRSLSRLARNPYLLSALIYLYDNAPEGDLPRNNGALMRALARALWERERQKQTPGWIPFEEMEEKFAKLAFAMIDEDKPIDVPVEYALTHLRDEALLKVGHSANLIEIRGNEVRFYHQLMQEYFAAKVMGKADDRIGRYILKPKFSPSAGRIATKWDNVIIAMAGASDDAEKLVNHIVLIDPYLASECIGSGINVSLNLIGLISSELTHEFSRSLSGKLPLNIHILKLLSSTMITDIIGIFIIYPVAVIIGLHYGYTNIVLVGFFIHLLVYILRLVVLEPCFFRAKRIHDDKKVLIQIASIRGLGILREPRAVAYLLDLLATRGVLVQQHQIDRLKFAAIALEDIGTPEALNAAVTYWMKELNWANSHAAEALDRIGTPEALEAIEKWRREQENK